ncbi:DASH complex, subunit Spc34 [Trichodelitschia bisporula]|uniref:DASH complex subunit SPC34 n=1 Tax=Trichodelitschia bisporula TaxID=703511 RepID=A0A6G1I238_9PEZI|nr:DASH complex, subunit Spc34 [Trichodelitschia bisporula]
MSLLDAHLEQITLCSVSIAELSFPPPKIFTNALLHPHDITTLIRDTEAHERALFSVPPPEPASKRRTTLFPETPGPRAPRRNTAVAAVLGGDLVDRIRRGGGGGAGSGLGYSIPNPGRERGEVDVEVLLEGAERLCAVYPIPGAAERIRELRGRHARLVDSVGRYEERVREQEGRLRALERGRGVYEEEEDGEDVEEDMGWTVEDMAREEEEIRELERKKKTLEERVTAMERDISGVMR